MTTKNYQAESFNKDSCTLNSILNIYLAFFCTNNFFFRTINKILRIRYSIIFFRIIEYFHFRRLFSRLHKKQRTIVKSLRRKNICNQEEIYN
jgi:hypothetical protein